MSAKEKRELGSQNTKRHWYYYSKAVMSLLPRFYSLLKMASGMVYLIQQREREERQNEMKKTKQGKWVERQRTIGRNREPNNKTNSTELGCANSVFCFKANPTPPHLFFSVLLSLLLFFLQPNYHTVLPWSLHFKCYYLSCLGMASAHALHYCCPSPSRFGSVSCSCGGLSNRP